MVEGGGGVGVNSLGNKERLVQNQAHTKSELEVSEMALIGEVGLARKYRGGLLEKRE